MSEAEAIFEINCLEARLSLATHGSKTFEALELALKLLRAQEQNEPLTLTGTRRIGEVITGRIVALDAEKGLASIHWEPYAHEPTHAPLEGADK